MNVKQISTGKLIDPSGRILLIFLGCFLIVEAIAVEYFSSAEQFELLFPLLTGAAISALLGMVVVPILNRLKTGQIIREDGPEAHLKKAGTPTMGGVFFIPVAIILALVWASFTYRISSELIAVCLVTFGYGFIGWLDDWQVLRRKSNKGISPRLKLILQVLIGTSFAGWLFWTSPAMSIVSLPSDLNLSLGWLFLPLAIFVFAAESNATNLTDGVDGLAAGTGAIACLGLGATLGSDYAELAIFCACFSGSCWGFLVHNCNPAVVFMGDTGSLALGGALAAIGLSSGNLWALFLVSGIFFVESLSVIAQVGYYKATKGADGKGKRLFKMAPIHHHFELSGWSETQVVGIFYLINIFLVAIAYVWR